MKENTVKEARYLYKGTMKTVAELREISQVSDTTIRQRIADGWSVESAVDTPAHRSIKKQQDGRRFVNVIFVSTIANVFPKMQPTLGKIYRAEFHPTKRSSRQFYSIKLENGLPLIVYPGEFIEISTARDPQDWKEDAGHEQRNCITQRAI